MTTTFCTNCGEKAAPGDRYCAVCGHKLRRPDTSERAAALAHERPDEDTDADEPEPTEQPPYSIRNFVILNLMTLGIYQMYWGWQAWEAVKRLEGHPYNATLRGIFLPFTAFSLFPKLDALSEDGQEDPSRATKLAVAYFGLMLAGLITLNIENPLLFALAALALTVIAVIILLPVHAALNDALRRKPVRAIEPHYWLAIPLAVLTGLVLLSLYTEIFMPEVVEPVPGPDPFYEEEV